jgi:MFS family permease
MVKRRTDHKFSLVLPVLFYEYLAISITRSLIPKMIVNYYGNNSYLAVGVIETAKGCLAFLSCPIFGRLSDRIGRKYCLLVTVIGTTLPVCMMAFTDNMIIYGIMMSLSGFFR